MRVQSASNRLLALVGVLLGTLALLAVLPYGGNVSALLKIEAPYGRQYDLPPGLVMFEDGGYDGMLFHQMARELPAFARGEVPGPVRGAPRRDRPYRWQRPLLSVAAYAAVLGNVDLLPWGFLAVNLAAALAALGFFVRTTGRTDVHALAVVLNPAVLTGLLYSTAEPLSVALVCAFLLLWRRDGGRVTVAQSVLLVFAVFTREVNLFLALALALYAAGRRRWRDVALALAAVPLFALWHLVLFWRFGAWPLRTGYNAFDLPLAGILDMLGLAVALERNPLSSAAWLAVFLVPLVVLQLRGPFPVVRDRMVAGALALMTVLLLGMHLEIWEAITGIGRVLPALYPVYALVASDADTPAWRILSASLCVLSVAAAVGVALSLHPFVLT